MYWDEKKKGEKFGVSYPLNTHTRTQSRWIINKFALGVKRGRLLLGIFKRMQRLNMHILKL